MNKKIQDTDERKNKVPNDFFGNWNNVRIFPYKEVIEKHLRKTENYSLMCQNTCLFFLYYHEHKIFG